MYIAGLQKTTLLDYPGTLAATVFTKGCNFACPFCQNSDLLSNHGEDRIPEEEILGYLKKRRNLLEGVCITGGEPTLQPDLIDFIRRVKELGYRVKLDTNGSHPEVLRALIQKGLIDYVAMDVKASELNYQRVAGCKETELIKVRESVEILKNGTLPFEFRTTLVKGLHTQEDILALCEWIRGTKQFYLQNYKESDRVLSPQGLAPFSTEELQEILKLVQKVIPEAKLRGVES